jgi:hypothetical protein
MAALGLHLGPVFLNSLVTICAEPECPRLVCSRPFRPFEQTERPS